MHPTLKDYNHKISDRVISIIKANKIKRDELATDIDVDKFKLDNYLQKKAKWDINYVFKICEYFDLSIDELLDDDVLVLKEYFNDDKFIFVKYQRKKQRNNKTA